MGVKGMWAQNATALTVLIMINMAVSMTGEVVWIVVAALSLLVAMYLCFRQGMGIGHKACGVSSTIEGARRAGEDVYAQLDEAYLSQAWSTQTGVRGLLISALIPYAVGGIYIILALLKLDVPATVARVAAWILSVPYWPFIMHWHESFVELTPMIGAMLLITPFVLPLCTFLGYLQGAKLWARTEEAMKQGRRRAKANARVGKKWVPQPKKPEI